MAVLANLSQFTGEDRIYQITVYSSGTTPQNITGWSLAFRVHVYGDPGSLFLTKTTGGGGIVLTNPTLGILQVSLAAADTSSLTPDEYQFFLERTDTSNDLILTAGLFTLLRR